MDPVLAVVLRGALALLLIVAALHKLRDRASFRATLEAYALLPAPLLSPLARAVPLVELAAAALLVTSRAAPAGGVLAALLLAVYALAMGVNLLRGRRDLDCGCMGPGARSTVGPGLAVYALAMGVNLLRGRRDLDCGCMGPGARSTVGPGLVVRNLVLIVAALAAGFFPVQARALVWVDFVTVPLAIAVLAALYASAERLLALAPAVATLRAEVRAALPAEADAS